MYMPGHPNNEFSDYVWEVMKADEDDLSIREEKLIEDLCSHGEIYPAHKTSLPNGKLVLSTDLGSPDSEVQMILPPWVKTKDALIALSAMCARLID